MPAGLRFFAASPAATCGRAAKRTAPAPSAGFATPILSAPTARWAASSSRPMRWPRQIEAQWPAGDSAHRFVVMTGGEPLLQVDTALIDALHARGFQIAVETNGTIAAPDGIDWLCVSPKAGAPWVQREGHELKVVWPQPALDWAELQAANFSHRYLQPMDNPDRAAQYRDLHCAVPGAARLAPEPANPQDHGHPMNSAPMSLRNQPDLLFRRRAHAGPRH